MSKLSEIKIDDNKSTLKAIDYKNCELTIQWITVDENDACIPSIEMEIFLNKEKVNIIITSNDAWSFNEVLTVPKTKEVIVELIEVDWIISSGIKRIILDKIKTSWDKEYPGSETKKATDETEQTTDETKKGKLLKKYGTVFEKNLEQYMSPHNETKKTPCDNEYTDSESEILLTDINVDTFFSGQKELEKKIITLFILVKSKAWIHIDNESEALISNYRQFRQEYSEKVCNFLSKEESLTIEKMNRLLNEKDEFLKKLENEIDKKIEKYESDKTTDENKEYTDSEFIKLLDNLGDDCFIEGKDFLYKKILSLVEIIKNSWIDNESKIILINYYKTFNEYNNIINSTLNWEDLETDEFIIKKFIDYDTIKIIKEKKEKLLLELLNEIDKILEKYENDRKKDINDNNETKEAPGENKLTPDEKVQTPDENLYINVLKSHFFENNFEDEKNLLERQSSSDLYKVWVDWMELKKININEYFKGLFIIPEYYFSLIEKAVEQNWLALQFIDFNKLIEIIETAFSCNWPLIFKKLSEEINQNDWFNILLDKIIENISIFINPSEKDKKVIEYLYKLIFTKIYNICMLAVKQNWDAYQYIPKFTSNIYKNIELNDNRELAVESVTKSGFALQFVATLLQTDKEILEIALRKNPEIIKEKWFQTIFSAVYKDKHYMKIVIESKWELIKELPHFHNDDELKIIACTQCKSPLWFHFDNDFLSRFFNYDIEEMVREYNRNWSWLTNFQLVINKLNSNPSNIIFIKNSALKDIFLQYSKSLIFSFSDDLLKTIIEIYWYSNDPKIILDLAEIRFSYLWTLSKENYDKIIKKPDLFKKFMNLFNTNSNIIITGLLRCIPDNLEEIFYKEFIKNVDVDIITGKIDMYIYWKDKPEIVKKLFQNVSFFVSLGRTLLRYIFEKFMK